MKKLLWIAGALITVIYLMSLKYTKLSELFSKLSLVIGVGTFVLIVVLVMVHCFSRKYRFSLKGCIVLLITGIVLICGQDIKEISFGAFNIKKYEREAKESLAKIKSIENEVNYLNKVSDLLLLKATVMTEGSRDDLEKLLGFIEPDNTDIYKIAEGCFKEIKVAFLNFKPPVDFEYTEKDNDTQIINTIDLNELDFNKLVSIIKDKTNPFKKRHLAASCINHKFESSVVTFGQIETMIELIEDEKHLYILVVLVDFFDDIFDGILPSRPGYNRLRYKEILELFEKYKQQLKEKYPNK